MKLKLKGRSFDAMLDSPNKSSNVGIILIQGVNPRPLGEYDKMAEAFTKAGFHFLRYESWKSVKDLFPKTFKILAKELDDAIEFMQSNGCRKIGLLGKSLGGAVALAYRDDAVKAMVLWPPSLTFGEKSNIREYLDVPFGRIDKVTDVVVDKMFLSEIKVPVRVIHGEKDDVVTTKNSKSITDALPKGDFVMIKGADHSFRKHQDELISMAVEFFKKNLR